VEKTPRVWVITGQLLTENAEKLKKVSSYLVADAYFSKKNFIDSFQSVGIHVVSIEYCQSCDKNSLDFHFNAALIQRFLL
jgi:hypothetical protein